MMKRLSSFVLCFLSIAGMLFLFSKMQMSSNVGLVSADDCAGATNTCCNGVRYMGDGSVGEQPWCGTVGSQTIDGPCTCSGNTVTCTPCGDGTACSGGQCVSSGHSCTIDGRCSRQTCTNECTIGEQTVNCQDNCGVWISHFACLGKREGGCSDRDTEAYSGALSNKSSIQYSEDYWCTTQQMDTNSGGGEYNVVWIGNNGEWCAEWFDGVSGRIQYSCSPGFSNKDQLDWDCSTPTPTPAPVTANLSAECYPDPQDYEHNLEQAGPTYLLKLTNINPIDRFQRATFALCFANSQSHSSEIRNYLGQVDWESTEIGSFCYNIAHPTTLVQNNQVHFEWKRSHTIANNRTLNDLAHQTQIWINEGKISDTYRYPLYSNIRTTSGAVYDSLTGNGLRLDLRPNACAQPPPAPQCNQIEMKNQQGGSSVPTLTPGLTVQFICNGNVETNPHYQFRVGKKQSGAPSPGNIQSSNSILFEIPADENGYGEYVAQCRVCSGSNDTNCSEWENWPN